MNKNLKGFAPLVIVVILALIGLGVVGYLVLKPVLAPASPTPTPPIVKRGQSPTPTSIQVEEGIDDNKETKTNRCTSDKDCDEGYACDYGTICGGSPETCQEYGTGKCYKLCSSNSDCSGNLTCQQKSFPVNNDFSLRYACFKVEE